MGNNCTMSFIQVNFGDQKGETVLYCSQPCSSGLRRLLREIRLSISHHAQGGILKPNDLKITQYILKQYRQYGLTEMQYCKASKEMTYLADTYATYLSSQRKWQDVHSEYHTKGDRTVSETARLVGLKLPQEYDPK